MSTTTRRRLSRVLITLALLAGLAPALGSAAAAATTCRTPPLSTPPGVGGVARVHSSAPLCAGARTLNVPNPYNGIAPLAYHGGDVMGGPSSNGAALVTVTPIFWAPSGYGFDPTYKSVIQHYLADVAADSGTAGNVFGTTPQYGDTDSYVAYHLAVGSTIVDTGAYPASGCKVSAGRIYRDNSTYAKCLDDDQIQAKITSMVSSRHLPTGLGRLYLMFLPKRVESCFYPASDTKHVQACTINPSASSSFCGYHGAAGSTSNIFYANLPFPIYSSPDGDGSCTDESLDSGHPGVVQSPNNNADADVVLSTTSHEMAEAITDPGLDAWYSDGDGSENGDLCAYDYGTLSGSSGAKSNQTINHHPYLTQTEFSQAVYDQNHYACIQSEAPAAPPTATSLSSPSGSTLGGQRVTIRGTSFVSANRVTFDGIPVSFTVVSPTSISATAPAHAIGVVGIQVTNTGGTSPALGAPTYEFIVPPVVTTVAPSAGRTSAGHIVTLTGSAFTGATTVLFGSSLARFSVVSDTRITAVTPAHTQGTVNVVVVTGGGPSSVSAATIYVFLDPPAVTKVSPASGSHHGATTVVITGRNFLRVTAVRFGANAASFTVTSSTTMTVHTPAHAAGWVHVLVYTPGGTSTMTSADLFRFI